MQGFTGDLMGSRVSSILLGAIMALSLFAAAPSSAQELDSWELGINYPGEDSTNPFLLSNDGSVKVEFFVENSGLTEITVEFEFNVPFSGKHEAPEGETISAGSNETFDLKISEIDVLSHDAEKKEKFSITATITARQGVPDPLSSSQNREGDLEIPSIFDLSVEISEPFGPMNAGSETILTVTVTNDGNAQDGVGEVDVKDDCPLLTTDNGLDSLLSGNIEAGKQKDANLKVTASESHPKRHCDITVTVTSKREGNGGGNPIAEGEVRVTVEPPPSGDSGSNNQGGGSSDTEEAIESNLSAPGAIVAFSGMLGALIFSRGDSE
ncbi:MAG: hypothetical protein VX626_02675 [Candidatus Thermoplasmatota archaeon]|jgi:hypothetical protein|nr:hypothetical protein [Candidatus Thermoplasmatota archaeon]|tara:strand:+ start:14989 stop:15960 length:972 start_codon:yes stop_codon:yes gene_type:complete